MMESWSKNLTFGARGTQGSIVNPAAGQVLQQRDTVVRWHRYISTLNGAYFL